VVQTITSSVDFVTGSTRFGSINANTHVFSGSVTMNPGGLFVSSSGLVGIGNVVPAYTLDVSGTGRFTGQLITNSTSFPLDVYGTTNNYGLRINNIQAATLFLYSSNANAASRNWGLYTNSEVYGDFDIRQSNAINGDLTSGANGTSRFYIKNDGNVGIGTSSPTNGKLEIQQGATTAGLWVQTGGTTTGYVIADFRTGTNLSALKILGNGSCEFGGSLTVGKLFSTYNGSQFINTSSGLVNYIDLSTIMSNHDSAIISIGQGNDNKLAKATVIVQRTAYTSGVTYSVATLGTQPIAAYLSFAISGNYLQMQTTAANATYYYNALVIPAY